MCSRKNWALQKRKDCSLLTQLLSKFVYNMGKKGRIFLFPQQIVPVQGFEHGCTVVAANGYFYIGNFYM